MEELWRNYGEAFKVFPAIAFLGQRDCKSLLVVSEHEHDYKSLLVVAVVAKSSLFILMFTYVVIFFF